MGVNDKCLPLTTAGKLGLISTLFFPQEMYDEDGCYLGMSEPLVKATPEEIIAILNGDKPWET